MAIEERPTGDGSITYYNSEFDQTYHSNTGALEEAFEKYAAPLKLETIEKKSVSCLDFCFGLSYNTLAALNKLIKNPNVKDIKITCLEIDKEILRQVKESSIKDFKEAKLITDLLDKVIDSDKFPDSAKFETTYNDKSIILNIIVDDAAKAIKDLKANQFDFIFFDPFSPAKCPNLWVLEVFKETHRVLKKGGKLATYSCARKVRDAMRESKYEVIDGPNVGRRSPSTIGIK